MDAWYTLAGSVATGAGAFCGGVLTQVLRKNGMMAVASYRVVVISYEVLGLMLSFFFTHLCSAAEAASAHQRSGFPGAVVLFWKVSDQLRANISGYPT
jgi:hypothetical protein